MVQYEINITGRVQGVGFRYFVFKRANELGLSGWVKNTRDGVKVMVQGDQPGIETLTDYLRIGPSMARVKNVSRIKIPQPDIFEGFTIK